VKLGSRVTLRSLLPGVTWMVRVSGFHPEFGMETMTVCIPTAALMVIGVTLPVSTPSTETDAPAGNEVIFSAPFCASRAAGTPRKSKAAAHTANQSILLLSRIMMVSSFSSPSKSAVLRCHAINRESVAKKAHQESTRSWAAIRTVRRNDRACHAPAGDSSKRRGSEK
jgi:hypothetical protein